MRITNVFGDLAKLLGLVTLVGCGANLPNNSPVYTYNPFPKIEATTRVGSTIASVHSRGDGSLARQVICPPYFLIDYNGDKRVDQIGYCTDTPEIELTRAQADSLFNQAIENAGK